jgi:hypothetical protein
MNMNLEEFLKRTKVLSNLVIENLHEKFLRKIVITIGSKEEEIKEFRSIKLLTRIVKLCEVAVKSGLKFPNDNKEINDRRNSKTSKSKIEILDVLNELRISDAHKIGKYNEKIKRALQILSISNSMVASGWGIALDRIYDLVGEAIESSAKLISIVNESHLNEN